tara:strand:- start:277 stop:474 length:198 start_codon:yes stop_codon:yes gene_type:complete
MKVKKKLFQQLNFRVPIGLWQRFEMIWLEEKNKTEDKKVLKADLQVEIFKKGLENWKKKARFLGR